MKQELSIEVNKNQVKIADEFGFTPAQLAVLQNTVVKGANSTELAYFIGVCKSIDLNPFNKEVWGYKDAKGNFLIFAGRDGFLAKAQKHPQYNGMRSAEICENDEFEIDIANNEIKHKVKLGNRGGILGAYAIVFRKDGEPTIELSEFSAYNKGYNAWRTHPAEMIKKVAESHALKKAFGISGVQSEHDFNVDANGIARPLDAQNKELTNKLYNEVEEVVEVEEIIDDVAEDDFQGDLDKLNEEALNNK